MQMLKKLDLKSQTREVKKFDKNQNRKVYKEIWTFKLSFLACKYMIIFY